MPSAITASMRAVEQRLEARHPPCAARRRRPAGRRRDRRARRRRAGSRRPSAAVEEPRQGELVAEDEVEALGEEVEVRLLELAVGSQLRLRVARLEEAGVLAVGDRADRACRRAPAGATAAMSALLARDEGRRNAVIGLREGDAGLRFSVIASEAMMASYSSAKQALDHARPTRGATKVHRAFAASQSARPSSTSKPCGSLPSM